MPYAPFVGSKMGNEACDLVIQDGSQYIFVECKVESAHNQLKFSNLSAKKVTELEEGCNNDVWKLAQLKPEQFRFVGGDGASAVTSEPARISKWILIVAWSIKGKAKVLSASAPNIFTDITTDLVFWVATVD